MNETASREILLTKVAIAFTSVAAGMLALDLCAVLMSHHQQGNVAGAVLQGVFILIIAILQFGVFVYLLTRLQQLRRHADYRRPPIDLLEGLYETHAPRLAVLVPSYKEDPRVVRRTLLSAALLDYPNHRVTLLIDDPPRPSDWEDTKLLAETRLLASKLDALLRSLERPFKAAKLAFDLRLVQSGAADLGHELVLLADLYGLAATRVHQLAAETPEMDHEDRYFRREILGALAKSHHERAAELRKAAADPRHPARCLSRVRREFHRLSRLFAARVDDFERKRFASLSHEPNKAMNLNSYLGLMGRTLSARNSPVGTCLADAEPGESSFAVPDADYVITLDADSILAPGYALELIHFMERPENTRVSVVQTPYSAFPQALSALERIAGATTDIQYLVHQGFTGFNATFWVGANALLRKAALEDIAAVTWETGHPVHRFIQDRTVIEDTESSVDLVCRDWSLHNYPTRLAWSATPPDFGALLIQRRRWANGGLIILPKFLRYIFRSAPVPHRLGHAAMGLHYLTSLATVNVGILALLAPAFNESMRAHWLPAALVPYFLLYARDLARIGYRAADVLNVYALTVLLIPVHLGGVVKSLQQILTGRRSPFGRTPKIRNRTATPALYLAAVYGLAALSAVIFIEDVVAGRSVHAAFAFTNLGFLLYGLWRFIGIAETVEDVREALAGLRTGGEAHQSAPTSVEHAASD